ncbi:MAG: GNAT family N-acetyltransferase [Pseudomonadota bacterium]
MNFTTQQISYTHPSLADVIKSSVGFPTNSKIQKILQSYNEKNQYIIGAFFSPSALIGMVGFEKLGSEINLRHISILEEYRRLGIGRAMLSNIITKFSPTKITTETDQESVDFYRNIGFICSEFEGQYGLRYVCILNLLRSADT